MPTPQPPTLDQIARGRIRSWMAATGTTQVRLGEQIGRNQAWMSRYLSGDMNAGLDELQKIARVFGHSVSSLLDSPTNPEEATVIELYRATPAEDRPFAVQFLRKLAQPRRAPKTSTRRHQ